MAKLLFREQYIKRGRFLRKLMKIFLRFQNLGAYKNSIRDEKYIETEFGKVRTLWYGF